MRKSESMSPTSPRRRVTSSDNVCRWADSKFSSAATNFVRKIYNTMGVMAVVMGVRIKADGTLGVSV